MASIGQQIIAARKAKGMTQDALAAALNVSRSAISNYETDRRLPDAKMLLTLSKVLNYSFEDETRERRSRRRRTMFPPPREKRKPRKRKALLLRKGQRIPQNGGGSYYARRRFCCVSALRRC